MAANNDSSHASANGPAGSNQSPAHKERSLNTIGIPLYVEKSPEQTLREQARDFISPRGCSREVLDEIERQRQANLAKIPQQSPPKKTEDPLEIGKDLCIKATKLKRRGDLPINLNWDQLRTQLGVNSKVGEEILSGTLINLPLPDQMTLSRCFLLGHCPEESGPSATDQKRQASVLKKFKSFLEAIVAYLKHLQDLKRQEVEDESNPEDHAEDREDDNKTEAQESPEVERFDLNLLLKILPPVRQSGIFPLIRFLYSQVIEARQLNLRTLEFYGTIKGVGDNPASLPNCLITMILEGRRPDKEIPAQADDKFIPRIPPDPRRQSYDSRPLIQLLNKQVELSEEFGLLVESSYLGKNGVQPNLRPYQLSAFSTLGKAEVKLLYLLGIEKLTLAQAARKDNSTPAIINSMVKDILIKLNL